MAQSVGILPGVVNSGINLMMAGGRNCFYGESVPLAVPSSSSTRRYGGEHARSPPAGAPWAYVTDAGDTDHFVTLGVSRGASKREIKSAYKRLALKYHPDVCKGDACTRSFVHITTAYERAMQGLPPLSSDEDGTADEYVEGCMGVGDESWDDWEEWMGWEGAGTRDYSSHVNVHI